MKDADALLRDFAGLADQPPTGRYLDQLARTGAVADSLAALLHRFEQKMQRLEALHGASPRAVAGEILALTRAAGKRRGADADPLAGWKKLDLQGEPIALGSENWSAVADIGHRLMWTVNADRSGDEPHPCRKISWRVAQETLAGLNHHAWCGHRDWRIPVIDELATLAYTTEDGTYRISDTLFPDVSNDGVYWSATRFQDTRLLQAFSFEHAERLARMPSAASYVRFVRTVGDDET